MTDKQIIIDGVDVSGCGFYHSVTGTECHIALAFAEEYTDNDHTYLKCEQNPNCYYKQLKRKEQELQEAMDNYVKLDNQRVKEYNELVDKYNNKEQECEELKTENKKLKEEIIDLQLQFEEEQLMYEI